MREVVLDTETTGLDPTKGDRVFELGCVELQHHLPTGRTFYALLDPQRPLSSASIEITGFKDQDLKGKPKFNDIVDEFIEFIAGAALVIHNAAFDMKFLNSEMTHCGKPILSTFKVIDTLALAKKRFPGAQANLDALCRRFGIDNSNREKHGALLDSELLAEVYLELCGGRQPDLGIGANGQATTASGEGGAAMARRREPRPLRKIKLTEAERAAHDAFVQSLGEDALWVKRA